MQGRSENCLYRNFSYPGAIHVYIRLELKRQIRDRFGECCAYCRTAEFLTVMTFKFEHIWPLSVDGETVCHARPFHTNESCMIAYEPIVETRG